ncbi:putative thiopurine S-methyltransferase isoform X2 [Crassostrea virginica]
MSDTCADWVKAWDDDNIGFHQQEVDQGLLNYADRIIKGRNNIKIFLPLCGKTVDIKWLWEKGHTVIGVEVARKALEEFFKEHSINYTVSPFPNGEGEVFTSEDKRILLYCCDLFKFSSFEGQIEAVWDRASLVAIDKQDQRRYAALMKRLISKDCQYLLETVEYDGSKYGGPPNLVPEQEIKQLFGDLMETNLLEKRQVFPEEIKAWGIDSLFVYLYILSCK